MHCGINGIKGGVVMNTNPLYKQCDCLFICCLVRAIITCNAHVCVCMHVHSPGSHAICVPHSKCTNHPHYLHNTTHALHKRISILLLLMNFLPFSVRTTEKPKRFEMNYTPSRVECVSSQNWQVFSCVSMPLSSLSLALSMTLSKSKSILSLRWPLFCIP